MFLRFLLMIVCLILGRTSCYAYFTKTQEQSQNEIIRYLYSLPSHSSIFYDPTATMGLLSSAISLVAAGSAEKLNERGFKEYLLETDEGFTTKAMVKIQANERRPLVVFVAGIGGVVRNKSLMNYALPLAKYLGWHVILLENPTNREWIGRNQAILGSGYESGYDLYLKLKAIRDHRDIGPYISEMHVSGMSLGGNDLAHALYFDSVLNTHLVDGGAIVWSAPASRYEGLKRIRNKGGIAGIALTKMMWNIYDEEVYSRYCDKGFYWIFRDAPYEDVIEEMYAKPTYEYLNSHPQHSVPNAKGETLLKKSYSKNFSLSFIKGLFQLDDYIGDVAKPLLWVHAWNDPIVDSDLTYDYLQSLKLPQQVGIMMTEYGGHGGFIHAYGGEWSVEVLVRYFEYWGRYSIDYYEQWRKPYEYSFKYLRQSKSDPV